MRDRYVEYTCALILNIVAGLIVHAIVRSLFITIVFLAGFLVITFLSLCLWTFFRVGFRAAAIRRRELVLLRDCIALTQNTLDYLGVIPMAHLPQAGAIDAIEEKARRGCKFRLLLMNPSSRFAKERRRDGGAFTPEQMSQILEELLERRQKLQDKRDNLRVAVYDEYPVWCIGIVDNDRCFLSFYGKGKAGVEWPAVSLKKGINSFYEACSLQFEKLWERATELD